MHLDGAVNINKFSLLNFTSGRAWAISPGLLESMYGYLQGYQGDIVNLSTMRAAVMGDLAKPRPPYSVVDGKAVIQVTGSLDKSPSLLSWLFGGSSTTEILANFEAALTDDSVDGIVLNVDSPGGAVDGTKELADAIFNARGKKPITSYVDSNAMSAAYWIASAADKVIAPDTARVGSIGVYMTHMDVSQRLQTEGMKPTYIYAGKYKVAGNSTAPLSNEDKDYLQGFVDKYYSLFVESVARNRGVSVKTALSNMADGRVFIGSDALDAGLVDKIGNFRMALKRGARSITRADGGTLQVDDDGVLDAAMSEAVIGEGMAFAHNNNNASDEPKWSSVDKTALPRIAFADQGDTDKKSTWKYPHHWTKGNAMFLHRGGLNAAWGAANGARSGKEASDAVKTHLQAHRKALGLKAEWDEKEWLNEAQGVFGAEFEVFFKNWYLVRRDYKPTGKKEEKVMDLNEFKATYPDMDAAIRKEAVDAYRNGEESAALSSRLVESEASNNNLAKKCALLEEKVSFAVADKEMDRILAASSVPVRLHGKVKRQVAYGNFVKDGEPFSESSSGFKEFSAAFDAEVKDWEKDMSGTGAGGVGTGAGKIDTSDTGEDALIERGRQAARSVTGKIRSDK